jgi:hypothetical protein
VATATTLSVYSYAGRKSVVNIKSYTYEYFIRILKKTRSWQYFCRLSQFAQPKTKNLRVSDSQPMFQWPAARSETLVKTKIDQGPHRTRTPQESKPNKSVKKVSFNLEQKEQNTDERLYNDQTVCEDTWYSGQDFKEFRHHTAKAVKALDKSQSKSMLFYERIITQTYAACCQGFKETDQVLTCYESEQLIQCMGSAKLLGLDKYAVKAVTDHRSERRVVMRKAVLFVQEDTDGNSDIIRAKSESISLTSRLYARSLGVALESEIMSKDNLYITTTATLTEAALESEIMSKDESYNNTAATLSDATLSDASFQSAKALAA